MTAPMVLNDNISPSKKCTMGEYHTFTMAHYFQFVHYAPHLKGEDPLSTHVARSHTVKVNRRNLAKRNRPELLGGVQSSRTPRPARLVSCEYSTSENSAATPVKHGDIVDETVDNHGGGENSKSGQPSQTQPLSSTISPVFGGHAMNAFDVAKSGAEVAEVAHYGEMLCLAAAITAALTNVA